jgi:hypothetical protein
MNSDFIFAKAKQHKICQDYALSGNDNNGNPYVILSDGCSGANDSDWGSRLICKAAQKRWVQLNHFDSASTGFVASNNFNWIKSDFLDESCLAATCILSGIKNNKNHIYMAGDGCIITKYKDGVTEVNIRHYSTNAPFYPYYHANTKIKEAYMEQYIGSIINSYYGLKENGSLFFRENQISTELNSTFSLELDTKDILWTAILSDGIESFFKPEKGNNPKNVSIEEIIPILLDFKTFGGEFVYRNLNWILNDLYKKGWYHTDDFSCGVIYFGES